MQKRYLCMVTVLAAVLVCTASAHAGSVTFGAVSPIPIQQTDWTSSLFFPEFNPALGTLTSVQVELDGTLFGSIAGENLTPNPATILSDLSAQWDATLPGGAPFDLNLSQSYTDAVAAFDGAADLLGPDSFSHPNVTVTGSQSLLTSNPVDLATFTGLGNWSLSVSATGTSGGSGPGALLLLTDTQAGADGKVTYNFREVRTPELPVLALLACSGILGVGVLRRRRPA